jgi:hypothetical protein
MAFSMASPQSLEFSQPSAEMVAGDQTELSTLGKRSRNRGGKRLILAVSSLFLLSGCSGLVNPFSSGSAGQSGGSGADSNLPQSIPEPYTNFIEAPTVISACGLDPVQSKVPGEFIVTGWGVINAKKGETPIGFVLEVTKNGKKHYASAELTERPDIVKKLSNPLLKFSGFTTVLANGSVTPPFSVKSFLVFGRKLFPCKYIRNVKYAGNTPGTEIRSPLQLLK